VALIDIETQCCCLLVDQCRPHVFSVSLRYATPVRRIIGAKFPALTADNQVSHELSAPLYTPRSATSLWNYTLTGVASATRLCRTDESHVMVFSITTAISVSVCLSICPFARLSQNRMSKFHQIFCTCYLWSYLGHTLEAMQYVHYVLPALWMTSCFRIMERIDGNQRWRYVSFSSPGGCTGGKVYRLRLHLDATTTRWLYCVECSQYSIRLEALGYLCTIFNFLHSTRPSVTWLNNRLWLAACDWLMSALSAGLSTRVERHRKFGSVQARGMTLNWFQQ